MDGSSINYVYTILQQICKLCHLLQTLLVNLRGNRFFGGNRERFLVVDILKINKNNNDIGRDYYKPKMSTGPQKYDKTMCFMVREIESPVYYQLQVTKDFWTEHKGAMDAFLALLVAFCLAGK